MKPEIADFLAWLEQLEIEHEGCCCDAIEEVVLYVKEHLT